MLEEVRVQQTSIVTKLYATELLWKSGSKGKDSAQSSNGDAKEVVKPFGPRAEPNEKAYAVRTRLPTTDLDGSNVSSVYFDSPQHVRVGLATPKRYQHEDTHQSVLRRNSSSFTFFIRHIFHPSHFSSVTDDSASSPRAEAPTEHRPFLSAQSAKPKISESCQGQPQAPKEPRRVWDNLPIKQTTTLGLGLRQP